MNFTKEDSPYVAALFALDKADRDRIIRMAEELSKCNSYRLGILGALELLYKLGVWLNKNVKEKK